MAAWGCARWIVPTGCWRRGFFEIWSAPRECSGYDAATGSASTHRAARPGPTSTFAGNCSRQRGSASLQRGAKEHAEFALQFAQQQQDLDLHSGIERGGRLVREQNFWPAGERKRNHRALAHAAGHFVRIDVQPPFCRRDPHDLEHLQSPRAPLCIRLAFVAHDAFGDLRADGVDRIERQCRLLEDHRHRLAAERRQLLVVHREHVTTHDVDLTCDLRALLRQ